MPVTVKLNGPTETMTVGSAPNEQLLVGLPNSRGEERVFFKTANRQINYLNGALSLSGLGFDLVSTFAARPCRLLRKGETVLIEGDN